MLAALDDPEVDATLIDVRSPQEYTGERTHAGLPEEGHCAAATSRQRSRVPWSQAADDAGRFRRRPELEEIYSFVEEGANTIAYCRIGERSSHTWFVLTHLLGIPGVRNHDGSWTEWGNTVRAPIVDGDEPGHLRRD